VTRLDHIGVIVRTLDGATAIYRRLGLDVERVTSFEYEGRQIRIAFIEISEGVELELIEAPDLLDSGAEPLHHVCFEVPDVRSELVRLAAAGVPLADAEPHVGASAPLVAFLETAAADGVRIELAQKNV
jgi:catechol 2,3-dioxygenase-like lactoylglutathione lyase family enzyme